MLVRLCKTSCQCPPNFTIKYDTPGTSIHTDVHTYVDGRSIMVKDSTYHRCTVDTEHTRKGMHISIGSHKDTAAARHMTAYALNPFSCERRSFINLGKNPYPISSLMLFSATSERHKMGLEGHILMTGIGLVT